jgi:hypothetical protein
MRQAVERRMHRFSNTDNKEEKAAIIWEVIQETYQSGGRFLKEDPAKNGWWEEVDQEAAKIKVSTHFRDLKYNSKTTPSVMTSSPTKVATTAPARHLSASLSSPGGSVQSPALQVAMGHGIPSSQAKLAATRSTVTQDLDSSTYEFLEAYSSRGRKRHKTTDGSDDNCGCFF